MVSFKSIRFMAYLPSSSMMVTVVMLSTIMSLSSSEEKEIWKVSSPSTMLSPLMVTDTHCVALLEDVKVISCMNMLLSQSPAVAVRSKAV